MVGGVNLGLQVNRPLALGITNAGVVGVQSQTANTNPFSNVGAVPQLSVASQATDTSALNTLGMSGLMQPDMGQMLSSIAPLLLQILGALKSMLGIQDQPAASPAAGQAAAASVFQQASAAGNEPDAPGVATGTQYNPASTQVANQAEAADDGKDGGKDDKKDCKDKKKSKCGDGGDCKSGDGGSSSGMSGSGATAGSNGMAGDNGMKATSGQEPDAMM